MLSNEQRLPDAPTISGPKLQITQATGDDSGVSGVLPTSEAITQIAAQNFAATKKGERPGPKPKPEKSFLELFADEERPGFRADARKQWQKLYETRRLNNPEGYALIAGPSFTAMQRELESYLEADDPDVPYYLITVNPPDTVRFSTLARRVEKCLGKAWIVDSGAYYCYAYEQRSESIEHVYGIHVHIILERPLVANSKRYRYSNFIREIRSSFTGIVGTIKHVDIRPIKRGTEHRTIKYVKGTKVGDRKQGAVEVNIVWRTQQGIPQFIEPVPFEDEVEEVTSTSSGDEDEEEGDEEEEGEEGEEEEKEDQEETDLWD